DEGAVSCELTEFGQTKSCSSNSFSGAGQYYFNARWYDPELGRFITEDPARSGDNWFAFCNNDPLSLIDPSGLDPITSPNYKKDPSGEHLVLQKMAANYIKNETGSHALPDAIRRAFNPKYVPGVVQWQYDNPKAAAETASVSHAWAEQPLQWIGAFDTVTVAAGAAAGASMIARDAAANEAASDPAVVTVSRSKYPESAQHIEDAQAAGKPSILTVDRAGATARRQASLSGTQPVSGMDRDEYPPAMFSEGGTGADIRPIAPSDNRGSGASMGAQVKGLPDGSQVQLKVTE
ncbi:MAG: NucA/NucB deoxyribonuclease domain-containing protein, partial [Terriglobales bacterium]